MSPKPVHRLAAGLGLICFGSATFALPETHAAARWVADQVGSGAVVWVSAVLIGFGLLLEACAALAAEARMRAERIRQEEVLAEARSVSFFAEEALDGVLILSDMGRRVEIERQTLCGRAGLLVLAAVGSGATAAMAVALGFMANLPIPGVVGMVLVTATSAVILVSFARAIGRTAHALRPTEAQVHAALIRHQEREEAERRLLRPNLAALAGAVIGEAPPVA